MAVVRWTIAEPILENFSFENENLIQSGLAEDWTKEGSPTLSLITANSYVKHRTYAQKIEATSINDGISQIGDISEISETDFTLIFYAYIPSGELRVKVEALDASDVVQGTVLNETYSSNSSLTKYSESLSSLISGTTITQLKIYFIQSTAVATTCYIDAILLFKTTDSIVNINPTTFSYSKIAKNEYQSTLDGGEVKIRHLDKGKRIILDGIRPVWMYLSQSQKEYFERIQGEDLIIITHTDEIYWLDLEQIDIQLIEDEEADNQHYICSLILKFVNR